ncbi:MAG: hypothetical protein EA361_09115 [Bacteroidetes bacterium]|nr:MAG: hypothetical protein EA361_09115 [Bacteroidota bacterium]
MDIRQEYESRIKKLENFIEDKGFGSAQLKKAKKVQRTVNAAVFLGGLITIAGIAIWAMNRD